MFHPVRNLLNPKFEGYKLNALDQENVVFRYPIENKPKQTTISGRSPLSFQEVQSRIKHNHLTIGPNGKVVYVDEESKLIQVILDEATLTPSFHVLYELPKPIQSPLTDDTLHPEYPSSVFVTPSILLVSDGFGSLFVLELEHDGQARLMNTFELSIPESYGSSRSTVPFRIHHALHKPKTSTSFVAILSSRFYPVPPSNEESKRKRINISNVEFDIWAVSIDLDSMAQDQSIPVDIAWHRRGGSVPTYVFYDETRETFVLFGGSNYRALDTPQSPEEYQPTADEIAPIPRAGENLDSDTVAVDDTILPPKPPPYSWTQTDDMVTIAFPLPSSTPKSAIKVVLSPTSLTVLIYGGQDILSGGIPLPKYSSKSLWDGIKSSSSLWTWDKEADHTFGLLTLHLEKQHEGTRWSQVFASAGTKPSSSLSPNDDDVEVPETLDPSELHAIREALEKYTIALQKGEDPSGLGLGHGVPSLGEGEMDESIDSTIGDVTYVSWVGLNGDVPLWSNSPGLDTPINVLSTPLPGSSSPTSLSVILKNTLDGVVFSLQPASNFADPPNWSHTSTFSVLSFVLASKRDTRFVHHIGTKAVLAFESGARDLGGNVYIYRNTAKANDKSAQQAVLKIGKGGGSLLGVGMLRNGKGGEVIVCLCEEEWVVMSNVL
ncbi:hypothetical protein C8Q75DRAFT_794710 [Abortiporus biennis]|nr:hypothetical protein C8Q75DRAFT_794710 [Abortiporus biennis]